MGVITSIQWLCALTSATYPYEENANTNDKQPNKNEAVPTTFHQNTIMKFLSLSSKAAFVGTQLASRNNVILPYPRSLTRVLASASAPTMSPNMVPGWGSTTRAASSSSRLFSSTSGGQQEIQLKNIGKEEMEEIIEDYEEGGRDDSGYIVMDVRERNEVEYTGKLSPNTQTLPLSIISEQNVFSLDEEEFEEVCGFAKPLPDETLVFSCAAGIRSVHAARFAAMNGYSNLINYTGGANQWFR